MIKTSLLIFFLTFWLPAEVIPYISPGAMMSWNFHNVQTVTLKISLGIGYDFNYQSNAKINSGFANLTFGKRWLVDFNVNQPDYFFTEIESGIYYRLFISGVGLGTAFFKNEDKLKIVPKASIFSGDLLFLRSDLILYNHKPDVDIGGMFVIPFNPIIAKDLSSMSNGSWNMLGD